MNNYSSKYQNKENNYKKGKKISQKSMIKAIKEQIQLDNNNAHISNNN